MDRPRRYYVDVLLPCPRPEEDGSCCCGPHAREELETDHLGAAKMARGRVVKSGENAAVYERVGVRPMPDAPGLYEWDEERIVVDWR